MCWFTMCVPIDHVCLSSCTSPRTPKQVIAEATHAQLHRAVQAGLLPQHRAHQQMQRCPLSSMPDAQGFCQAIGLAAQACIQHLQVRTARVLEWVLLHRLRTCLSDLRNP